MVVSGKKLQKKTQSYLEVWQAWCTHYRAKPKITSIQLLYTPSRLSASQRLIDAFTNSHWDVAQMSQSFRRFACLHKLRGKSSKSSANTCEQVLSYILVPKILTRAWSLCRSLRVNDVIVGFRLLPLDDTGSIGISYVWSKELHFGKGFIAYSHPSQPFLLWNGLISFVIRAL